MAHLVFAAKKQAELALETLTRVLEEVKTTKMSIRDGVERINRTSRRNHFSRSSLQR